MPISRTTGHDVTGAVAAVHFRPEPAGESLLAAVGNRNLNHNQCWLRIHAVLGLLHSRNESWKTSVSRPRASAGASEAAHTQA